MKTARSNKSKLAIMGAAVLLAALSITGGCSPYDSSELQDPSGCVDDNDCASGLCIVGVCLDPSAENIGQVDIEVRPPQESEWLPQQVFGVTPGSEGRQIFQLKPTAHFVGRLMSADGAPISARVLAIPDAAITGRSLVRSVDTDPGTGAFSLSVVAQEQYRVTFSPLDPQVATYTLAQPYASGPLAGEVELGDIRFPADSDLRQISGRVVAGEGIGALGIPALEVRIFDGSRRVSSVGITDDNGQFTVRLSSGEADGRPVTLEVRPSEDNALFPTVRLDDQRFDDDTIVPTIELGTAVTSPVPVSGRVVGPDSSVVPRATIYAKAQLGPGQLNVVATTDENGRYNLDLPPGEWTMAARAPSTNASAGLLMGRQVSVGGPEPALDLVVAPRVVTGGRVLNAVGDGVAEATLRLLRVGPPGGGASGTEVAQPETEWSFLATSNASGRWQAVLDPGRYRVSVSPPAQSGEPNYTRLVDIFTDPPDIDVELPPPAHLAGEMRAPDGSPVGAYGQIRVFTPFVAEGGESLQLGSSETAENGTFGVVLPDLLWTGRPDGPDDEADRPEPLPEEEPTPEDGPGGE